MAPGSARTRPTRPSSPSSSTPCARAGPRSCTGTGCSRATSPTSRTWWPPTWPPPRPPPSAAVARRTTWRAARPIRCSTCCACWARSSAWSRTPSTPTPVPATSATPRPTCGPPRPTSAIIPAWASRRGWNRPSPGSPAGPADSVGEDCDLGAGLGDHLAEDVVEAAARRPPGEVVKLGGVGDAPQHVGEPEAIGLLVGHEVDGRVAARELLDAPREVEDRDLLLGPEVEHLADGLGLVEQTEEAVDHIAHVAEAA